MIITINVTVGVKAWDPNRTQKEVEVKTESQHPVYLPWEQICANLVEAALEEWEGQEREREQEAKDAQV